jgi:predicted nuclease of restriction endonuclease-like (RecB) superfamily
VVEQLACDLRKAFPGIQGFSKDNVWRMRMFFLAYHSTSILAQPVPELPVKQRSRKLAQPVRELTASEPPPAVAGIPWGHNIVLMQKVKDPAQRLWYAAKAVEHGWSRAVLTVQIESDLFDRQGKAISNFAGTLPAPQSDLAQQSLKDPYLFDFLTLREDAFERDLELRLVEELEREFKDTIHTKSQLSGHKPLLPTAHR